MSSIVERLLDGIGSYSDLGRVSTSAGLIREAAKRIEDLEQQLSDAREANRKLHRRAQFGEGLFATVKFDLEMWITTLSSPPSHSSSWLFKYALRHMERAITRYEKKIDQDVGVESP